MTKHEYLLAAEDYAISKGRGKLFESLYETFRSHNNTVKESVDKTLTHLKLYTSFIDHIT